MATGLRRWVGAYGVILGLGVLLGVLAFLQFRWTNEIRATELERKQAAIEAGMNGFREDLHRELASICTGIGFRPVAPTAAVRDLYAQECGDWARSSDRRELVANYYLWEKQKNQDYGFLRFDPQEETFQAAACPARLGEICDAAKLVEARAARELAPAGMRWRFAGTSLGMVRPISEPGWRERTRGGGCPPDCSPAGFMVIELNRDAFLNHFLPELAQRYFGGADGLLYAVAVIDAANPPQFIYVSDAHPSPDLVSAPDATLHLFGLRRNRRFESRPGNPGEPGGVDQRDRVPPLPPPFPGAGREPPARGRGLMGAPLLTDAATAGWRLVVRHRGASLAEAVATTWTRNMLLGFGVLLVLAAGVALVFVWAQQIRRLAKLQMAFVASVSHELRTPVAVISSAAENLADGVVDSKPQVAQYGTVIRNEAQRLGAMIEQVLLFAATRDAKGHYESRPVSVAETIDAAVANLAHLTQANGFTVDKEVAPDLPPVMADAKALSRCLQNLMTNALKYGVAGRWIGIRARAGAGPEAGEILISVRDRGQGIPPGEVPHIFEPFYRGHAARASQKHGAGLGLSLAKEAAEAMGGRLTVTSQTGEGSEFTLHFRTAK
jgi:signal transduction histidine kinase